MINDQVKVFETLEELNEFIKGERIATKSLNVDSQGNYHLLFFTTEKRE